MQPTSVHPKLTTQCCYGAKTWFTVMVSIEKLCTRGGFKGAEPVPPPPPLGDGLTVTVGLLLKTVLYCGDAIASYKQVTATHQSLSLALQARLAKTTLTRLK